MRLGPVMFRALLVTTFAFGGACSRPTEAPECRPEHVSDATPATEAPARPDERSQPPPSAAPNPQAAPPLAQSQEATATPKRAVAAVAPRATRLGVRRLVVAKSIDAREPVDVATSFAADGLDRLYAFVEVDNPERRQGTIVVSFEAPDGRREVGHVELNVGPSPRFRTWAYSRGVRELGDWTAVVRDEQGRELGREGFTITL